MLTFAQRERIRTALEKRANRSPVRSQGKFRRLSREGRLFDKFVEKKAAEIRKLNPQASEGAILDSIIEFINSGALEKILAFITAIIGIFGVLLVALTLALSASSAAACAPGDIAISKAEGEEITRELQAKAAIDRANAAEATHNAWGRIPTDGSKQYQPTLAGNGVPYPMAVASIDVARDCVNCRAIRQPAVLTPAQARWFRAMPLPRVAKVAIREMFGL